MDELVAILKTESEKRSTLLFQFRLACVLLVGVYFSAIAVDWYIKKRFPSDMAFGMSAYTGLIGVVFAVAPRQRKALLLASENEDPRLTTYLLEAASMLDQGISLLARNALVKRLEAVQEHGQLDAKAEKWLYESLTHARSQAYAVVAIEAVRRVGGREAIPWLEKFLNSPELRSQRSWRSSAKLLAQTALGDVRLRVARPMINEKQFEAEVRQAALIAGLPPSPAIAPPEAEDRLRPT